MKRKFLLLSFILFSAFVPPRAISQQHANSSKDSFFHNLQEIDSAGTKIPFGIILGLGKSFNTEYERSITSGLFSNQNYKMDALDDINLAFYFENFQFEYQKSWIGNRFSLLYRTTGRDAYSGFRIGNMSVDSKFTGTQSPEIEDYEYDKVIENSVPNIWFVGYKKIKGYDSTFSFVTLIDLNFGFSASELFGNTTVRIEDIKTLYIGVEFGIGFRIPISIVGLYAILSYQISDCEYPVNVERYNDYYQTTIEKSSISNTQRGIKLSIISSLNFDL